MDIVISQIYFNVKLFGIPSQFVLQLSLENRKNWTRMHDFHDGTSFFSFFLWVLTEWKFISRNCYAFRRSWACSCTEDSFAHQHAMLIILRLRSIEQTHPIGGALTWMCCGSIRKISWAIVVLEALWITSIIGLHSCKRSSNFIRFTAISWIAIMVFVFAMDYTKQSSHS